MSKSYDSRAIGAVMSFALLIATGSAQAANVTANASQPFSLNGANYQFTGTGTFTYSSSKVSNDSLGGITITSIGSNIYNNTNSTSVSPEATLTLNASTGSILGTASIGGEHQVAGKSSLMTGGSLDVINLTWNPSTKIIYADVHGAGNVLGDIGAVTQLDFFNVSTVTGATSITGAGTFTSALSGIYLTTDAMAYITKSLGLGSLAQSVTKGTDFGTVTSVFTVKPVAAVPEMSTSIMSLVGLLGLMLAVRRRSGATAQP